MRIIEKKITANGPSNNFFQTGIMTTFFWCTCSFACFFALLKRMLQGIGMLDNKIYFTRPNKDEMAKEDEIKRFEKSALSDFSRGKEVYIIEKFPKNFFYFATKIRLEKVTEPVPSLSEASNSHLFKVVTTHNIYE